MCVRGNLDGDAIGARFHKAALALPALAKSIKVAIRGNLDRHARLSVFAKAPFAPPTAAQGRVQAAGEIYAKSE
jgi:hypothetical protein